MPSSPRDSESLADVPKAKRQKVNVACDVCRSRKVKCDGNEPVCGPCTRRNDPCTWRQSAQAVAGGSQNEALQQTLRLEQENRMRLELHIRQLEERQARSASNSHGHIPPQTQPQPQPPPPPASRAVQLPLAGLARSPNQANVVVASPRRFDEQTQSSLDSRPNHEPTSAMVGSIGEADAHGFFRGSSAGSFIGQVRRAVERKLGTGDGRTSTSSAPRASSSVLAGPGSVQYAEPMDYVLPSRKRANALMAVYWDAVHPIYPYIDRVQTTQDYNHLWTGQGSAGTDSTFLCMINVVFAISSRLSVVVPPEERHASAAIFFQRARQHLDMWNMDSISYVQALLLMAQYLQSTDEPHQCWIFVGIAIRAAESLGLHLPETSERVTSPRQREMLRRIWHGCILMDRVLAMTYGRPTMIGHDIAKTVPLPLAVDEELLPQEPGPDQIAPPPNHLSKIDFFLSSLKLYKILYDILTGLNSAQETGASTGYLNSSILPRDGMSVLDIDRKLMCWESHLPNHIQYHQQMSEHPDPSIAMPVFIRQSIVLRQRFLHIRLLSLRPILSAFLASDISDFDSVASFGSMLSHRIAHQCSTVCIMVAQDTINLVYTHRSTDWATTGFLAAWWYNIYFVYSAATVLIAARLRSSIVAELSEDSIMKSWDKAIQILEDYSPYSASIPRLVATLHLLFEEVPVRYSYHNKQQQQHQNNSSSTANPPDPSSSSVAGTTGHLTAVPVVSHHRLGASVYPNVLQSVHEEGGSAAPPDSSRPPASYWPSRENSTAMDEFVKASHHMNAAAPTGLTEFDMVSFDPMDLSWLNTVPFGSLDVE